MGLDMYLKGQVFLSLWENEKEDRPSAYAQASSVLEAVGMSDFIADGGPFINVEVNVGYWRKANQIHNWFVTSIQGGKDECQKSYVSREKLRVLRDLCITALENRDPKILPPKRGFFFGSTEVDEYYWQDIDNTIGIVDKALALPEGVSIYYQASW